MRHSLLLLILQLHLYISRDETGNQGYVSSLMEQNMELSQNYESQKSL